MASSAFMSSTALVAPALAGRVNNPAFIIGAERQQGIEDGVEQIVSRLETLARDQVTLKSAVEERWLKNVRDYHGFYTPDTEAALKAASQSRAYVKATRAKTVALEARLFDMIFPTDDRNWGIEATPVPKLAKEGAQAKKRVETAAMQMNDAEAAGNPALAQKIKGEADDEAARAQAADAEIAKAQESADAMQEEMDDQLVESKYPQESRDMIHDACLLGSGILKGPLVNQAVQGRWLPQEGGGFALEYPEDPRPLVKRTDPWSFFPDMSARRIEEAEFTFERYLWSKRDLRKMVKTHNFNPDAVREILRGDRARTSVQSNLTYLSQLRTITGEGSSGEIKGRYVGWEYHGPLERDEVVSLLRATGDEEGAMIYDQRDDPLDEYRVMCFFCEGQLLKIVPEYPLDSGETLYSIYNVEESEGSMFGYGIPHIMADSAAALNSAWRMGLDNAGMSVSPQAVIDKDSIVPADGVWGMAPKKIWWRTKAAVPNAPDPVTFFNVPNNMNEIASIIKIALEFIDMETGIPMPQQGEQGAHTTQTFGGMAILQNASNIIFRRMVKNYDDGIITPTMRRLYDWNMQHSAREDIKGDMSIDARGTSVLLVKEIQAQNLMFIVANLLNNPQTAPMLKPYENVRKLFQSLMISPDDVMETKDAWMENVKAAAEAAAKQPDPATINANSRIEAANIQAKSRGVSDDVALMVAQLREKTALTELVQSGQLTMAEVDARVKETAMHIESKERMMAVEIGAERQNAEEARAHGERPTGSGGFVSSGTVDGGND